MSVRSERLSGGGIAAALEGLPAGPLWLGLALFAALACAYLIVLALFGPHDQFWGPAGPPHLDPVNRLAFVLIALLCFLVATNRHAMRSRQVDLRGLRPLTGLPTADFEALLERRDLEPRRRARVMAFAALIGIAVVPATQADPYFALDPTRWDGRLAWSFAANAVLFAYMGQGLYENPFDQRAVARVVASIRDLDLLDRSALTPLAHIGLRSALTWAGGSSIASLIFLDVERIWPVAIVVGVTLWTATRSLLAPAREVRRRIVLEKRAELTRVRRRIVEARTAALDQGDAGAALRLPGLLAWETRVERAGEWPFDASTLVRFAALVALALGSWLGGAVVERLLGAALG